MEPEVNNGKSENVPVSLPGWIVQLVDERVNKSLSLSRSSFIKSAILKALLPEKEDDAEFWEKYIREEGRLVKDL